MNEKVLISRIEQQIKVTKIVADCVDLKEVKRKSPKLANYMCRNVSIMMAAYRICELDCTLEQKQKIMKILHNDYDRRFHIHYAVCSLPFIVMGIPIYLKNQYTCSSYIAKLLQKNGFVPPWKFLKQGFLQLLCSQV